MLFNKEKKIVVKTEFKSDGFYGSATYPLKEGKLIQYLEKLHKKYHNLVIESVSEDEIKITSIDTKNHLKREEKLDEITSMIREYIRERTIDITAYAVFADGTLKGVFSTEPLAELKKRRLNHDGYTDEQIEIKPIEIGSFKDFA